MAASFYCDGFINANQLYCLPLRANALRRLGRQIYMLSINEIVQKV